MTVTERQVLLTPDGDRYIAMGAGQRVALPFHLRWLTPRLCRDDPRRWVAATIATTILASAGIFCLAHQHGLSPRLALASAVLWAGLPSVRFCWKCPVLVDMPTITAAVWAAVVFDVNPWAGVALALFAGCVNERAPVFTALFAWNPLPLVGLIAPAVRNVQTPGDDPADPPNRWIVAHPVESARMFHAGKWRNPIVMVLPWGGCLAALAGLDTQVVVTLAVCYAQLLVATDTVRLYQQAAPVVCIAAVAIAPLWLVPFLLAATWFNPLEGV